MLNLNFSAGTREPMYMQLYTQVRNQIRSGQIPHGTRLPSIKALQVEMSLSKTTVETAYHMLVSEGYVISKPRSGLYVLNPLGTVPASPAPTSAPFTDRCGAITPGTRSFSVDFKTSATDEHTFPLRTWRKVLQGALDNAMGEVCRYGDPQGEYPFRQVLAGYLRNSRGVICTPDQIVIGSGIQYSAGILARLFAGVQHMAFEEPGYAPVRESFRQNGFHLIPIGVGERGLSLAGLERSEAQALYVTPSHQFPTGSVMPYTERQYLLNWACERQAYIIEDDYDGEFRYVGKPIPSLQGLDQAGRVIYVGTFSKSFTPALRMNYMVLPPELAERMRGMPGLLDAPSRIDQWAMQAFIEQGHWSRHIRRMRNTYRLKHQRFVDLIRTHFGGHVEVSGHSAGLHLQVTVRTREPAAALVRLAAEAGVGVYDFHEMWMEQSRAMHPQIYLGFGGISDRQMELGVLALKKAWAGVLDTEEAPG